jgi:cyclic pyranopterin phosphate synthase
MSDLIHFGEPGGSRMVDVSDKPASLRSAKAMARVRMRPDTLALIENRALGKGDVVEVARLAGILAAKKTSNLIPLCHNVPLAAVSIDFAVMPPDCLTVTVLTKTTASTGVEMEALTAAAVAALTIYDMCKSVDRGMIIEQVALLEKHGGTSGDFIRNSAS